MARYRKWVFIICMVLGIAGCGVFLYVYRGKVMRILSPFLLSMPLYFMIKPVAGRLASRKIPMSIAILLVYLFFLLALAAVCIFFIPELVSNIREMMETLPDLVAQYERIFNNLLSSIKTSKWSDDVKNAIFREIENGIAMVQAHMVGFLQHSLNLLVETVRIIFDLAVGMVITYYVMKDSEKFRDYTLSIAPKHWRNTLVGLGREVSLILKGFIQGQLLTALIVGILETMGLLLVNIKYPLVLGMIGGLANIIPYFGPYIGAIPAVIVALTYSPMKAFWTVIVFLVVQQIDNSFISTRMIEGRLGLNPVATIFVVLVGGEFFGVMGMLLAVPVIAILRVLVNRAVKAII